MVLQKLGVGEMQVHGVRGIGWCRSKWLRIYQTIGNLTAGDMGIALVVIRLGVPD